MEHNSPADISCMAASRDACIREKANEQIDWVGCLIAFAVFVPLMIIYDWYKGRF
jgi:hypothetical protein